jgi:Ni,Fe-hydrogenase I cytochrome b subunit
MSRTKLTPVFSVMANLGLLAIAAGTVLPLIYGINGNPFENDLFKYIYAAGAVLLIVARLFTPYKGNNLRVKRLHRIETWSAIFFCVAVFFMFYSAGANRDWLAFTMAGGIIQAYTSIMIPREAAKAQNNDSSKSK